MNDAGVKLFLKILLFIFAMIITVEEIKSSTVISFSQETTTYQFQQTESKIVSSVFGNYSEKNCSKEEKVVTCSERGKERERVAANTGTTAIRQVGKHLQSVEDVMVNPYLLERQSLMQTKGMLGTSQGWINDVMRRSTTHPNGGWVLREMNKAGTDFTGRMIQYNSGTRRHFGGVPYWKVSSGSGTVRFPVNP